jgi:hypothetical protein
LNSGFLLFFCSLYAQTGSAPDWITNGPAVYAVIPPKPQAELFETNATTPPTPSVMFAYYLPGSLNNLVWTNFIAHTNGRTTELWSVRSHPPGWPTNAAPVMVWNTNSLAWGMRGLTALSPCWEDEGSSGQAPITLLTRRHGYTRGHSMGPDGFTTARNGKKVWFVTTNNVMIQASVKGAIIRTVQGSRKDYTILFFKEDLPLSITPMRVVAVTNLMDQYRPCPNAPLPVFRTEQSGNVSAEVPGFKVNTWKGGDSGAPDMLPMPGELVFFQGRSTSGPSPEMQADMDVLSVKGGVNPKRYQMQWVDLSKYPRY